MPDGVCEPTLRAAYQAAVAQPLGDLYQRGRRLGRPLSMMLRDALPDLAE